jgi:hypothetical protein
MPKTIKPTKIKQAFDESLSSGWKMFKKISEGYSSFFFYKPATYDIRTVYDRKSLNKLINEGFSLDQDAGILALNILKGL